MNGKAIPNEETPFPESEFITLDGVTHHYRHFTPEEGEHREGSVLLIHGFASSTFSWRKLFLPLTQHGYEVIAVDIPPFGFSDRSPDIDHSPLANAERLWTLLDSLGTESAYLVGHSMGARIAGAMGALEAERASGVLLVDGPFFGTGRSRLRNGLGGLLFNNLPFKAMIERIGRQLIKARKLVRKAITFVYGETPTQEVVEGYQRPLRIEGTGYSLPPYFLELSSQRLDMEDLKPPVHLIWGEKDRLFSHRMPKRFLKRYPYEAGISIIQGAGHCPMETHPEAFLEVLFQRLEGPP